MVPQRDDSVKTSNSVLNGIIEIKKDRCIPVVGIGTSAGGLEALELFFAHVDPLCEAAFVVIQHLDRTHKSLMASLLLKFTTMEIVEITDTANAVVNTIYLAPPDCTIALIDNVFYLTKVIKSPKPVLPIDFFFCSLAKSLGKNAIGIILSGSGSDGRCGVEAIKAAGGIIFAQSETQAKYSSMPESAINTGLVDFVLPAEFMPEQIYSYISKIRNLSIQSDAENCISNIDSLNKIIILVREHTGHDFTLYKKSTLIRRVERRMAANQVDTIENYVVYIVNHSDEIMLLFNDLLINVTRFFRDSEAFTLLENDIIPQLIDQKKQDSVVRIWVCGCSSGEEAYSFAILFTEIIERKQKSISLQIFASDIDSEAIDFGRKALYPSLSCASIGEDRLRRYFTKEGDYYHVNKSVRDKVIFAIHDIVKDPPFSQIDMVSCRNVLIYMDQKLQKKLISTFHYSLFNKGILFLGASESIGEFSGLFFPVNTKWKLFYRIGTDNNIVKKNKLYNSKIKGSFLNNDYLEKLYKNEPDENLNKDEMPDNCTDKDSYILLRKELGTCRELLRNTIDEFHNTHDEFQINNEELQSSNEELETSKEELQSTNEELITVNAELQQKVDQLVQIGNDVNNILAGTDIASLFLDSKMCIKRFTPAMKKIFRLIESDVGRSIHDITSTIVSFDIHRASLSVLETHVSCKEEVCDESDRWYSLHILPYRTMNNLIDGVVVTLVDITDLKNTMTELSQAKLLAESIVETISEPFIVLDSKQFIRFANRAFYKEFNFRPEETINKHYYNLGKCQWDNQELRILLDTVISTNTKIIDYQINYLSDNMDKKKIKVNALLIPKTMYILLTLAAIS